MLVVLAVLALVTLYSWRPVVFMVNVHRLVIHSRAPTLGLTLGSKTGDARVAFG